MENFSGKKEEVMNYMGKNIQVAKKWIMNHLKLSIACGIGMILVLVVGGIFIVNGKGSPEIIAGIGIDNQNGKEGETVSLEVLELPLEENAYEDVNLFISEYYRALADGEMEKITSMRSYTDDLEKARIEKKSDYIEEYQNIICYTKKGPIEDSHIVYVYYDIKMDETETLAPGMHTHYLYTQENGELMIQTSDMDENISNYIKEVTAQDDVVDLSNSIQVKFNEAVEADETLEVLLSEISIRLATEVGDQLASDELEATVSENIVDEPIEEEEPVEEEVGPSEVMVETVKANATVNVRSSDSIEADKLGKVSLGSTMIRYENKENGWSKIDYEGQDGFIKSEFLDVDKVETQIVVNTDSEEGSVIVPEGKIIIKETVNIRKKASIDSEQLGVAYIGDHYDLIMHQADGWSKILYKEKEAFVKTEFLE